MYVTKDIHGACEIILSECNNILSMKPTSVKLIFACCYMKISINFVQIIRLCI